MTEVVYLSDVTTSRVAPTLHGGALSIGNFDGVHLGHASLLGITRSLADAVDGPAIACVFDPHPIAILRPQAAPQRLSSITERARRLNRYGIDFLVVCQTTQELLNLSAETFFQSLVRDVLKCRAMVEGENFCFGKDRVGDVELLKELCAAQGIRFQTASMLSTNGAMVSSTRIRNALLGGDVRSAAEMLATPHRVTGKVVHGDARGRTLGFPTANLSEIQVVVPKAGVYAAVTRVDGNEFAAAVHIGESPTFQSGDPGKVEVHLLDFSGDLYGKSLSVDFIDRVRDITRFDSPDQLTAQLRHDIEFVRMRLSNRTKEEDS